jgi:diketogulonate reductase-like aldo/keto reductase
LAIRKKCTPAQLALGWLLAQGEDIVPIPGTKRRKYLEENVAALTVELAPVELEEISSATPPRSRRRNALPGSKHAEYQSLSGRGELRDRACIRFWMPSD